MPIERVRGGGEEGAEVDRFHQAAEELGFTGDGVIKGEAMIAAEENAGGGGRELAGGLEKLEAVAARHGAIGDQDGIGV